MRSLPHWKLLVACLLAAIACEPIRAVDTVDSATPPSLDELVEQLRSNEFAQRRKATIALRRMGEPAIPKLVEIARQSDSDARARALEILETHLHDGHQHLQEAARGALEQLAQGEGPEARAAAKILSPPTANPSDLLQRQLRAAQAMRIAQARLQIGRIQPVVPRPINNVGNITISISTNGNRVRIVKNGEGVEVEITETKNGMQVTEKFSAKSIEEMKTKHPRGYEILKKYGPRFGLDPTVPAEKPAAEEAVPEKPGAESR